MNWLKQLFLRQQLYGDVDKEIAFHLEARIEELVASGMSVKEATATARREFGNVELVKETAREAWGWRWLEDLSGDLRFGVRVMRKNPGFTAVVVLTLALAIGANTAVFTLLNGLVLKSLPVRDPAGLWLVGGGTQCCVNGGVQRKFELFPYPLFLQVRRQKDLFSDLAAFTVVNSTIRIRIGDAPAISAPGKLVSANYFAVLGAEPWLGRGFRPEEESSQQPVAVVSYRFWQGVLHGDPAVVGQSGDVNGQAFTVVGVAPRQFFGETSASSTLPNRLLNYTK